MKRLLLTTVLVYACALLSAQNVVNDDNTVTFRYKNDNAKSVQVDVQFAGRQDMTKGEDGYWTVTLGPAESDMYPYCFVVDGVSVMDPYCQEYFPNETFKNSLLNVNGKGEPMLYDVQDVPHGTVDYVNYWSETLGTTGRAIVYTPPFYEQNPDKEYPLMVLISGTTDTEEVYFKVGKMNLILDNLIAQGEAKEMIIVLPYGNPSLYFPQGTFRPMMMNGFNDDLINDLLPFVESNYRVIADRDHRGIGGFSRGGNQGLAAGLTNLDKFSWLCSYSSFTSMVLPGGIYDDPEKLNEQIHLFWLGVGNDDFLYGNAKEYMDFLDSKGINNIKVFTDGKFGHTWMNARYFLDRTFRLLFSDEPVEYTKPEPVVAEAPVQEAPEQPAGNEQRLTPEVMARLFPVPVISPQYGADGSVTLRVRAEGAQKVELESEMFEGLMPMELGDRGVWSITVTPDKADVYRYCFVIDGTQVADAANMFLSPDNGFKYSILDIPAAEPKATDVCKVAHGKVSYRYTPAGTVCVYTPAGYTADEKLPVIYLPYGKGDSYESWFKLGKIDNIMDNLIAAGKTQRAIVVMSRPKGVKAFIKKNYNCGRKTVDKSALKGHNWVETRERIIARLSK